MNTENESVKKHEFLTIQTLHKRTARISSEI